MWWQKEEEEMKEKKKTKKSCFSSWFSFLDSLSFLFVDISFTVGYFPVVLVNGAASVCEGER